METIQKEKEKELKDYIFPINSKNWVHRVKVICRLTKQTAAKQSELSEIEQSFLVSEKNSSADIAVVKKSFPEEASLNINLFCHKE